jgi:aconitate hydratase
MPYPEVRDPDKPVINTDMLQGPPSRDTGRNVRLDKGPNIASLPHLEALPQRLEAPVVLKVGDDISTDEILPAGARVLPYRSNIPEISKFCFEAVDDAYWERAERTRDEGGHVIVAGVNYGQGSSREHAALAPRFLGLRLVVAKSFARIHWENLVNFGVLPLVLEEESDYEKLEMGEMLRVDDAQGQIRRGRRVEVEKDSGTIVTRHSLSERQIEILLLGGLINWVKEREKRPGM